jgi:hypothetical protein
LRNVRHILEDLYNKNIFSNIKSIKIWSDGCKGQFKTKFHFYSLTILKDKLNCKLIRSNEDVKETSEEQWKQKQQLMDKFLSQYDNLFDGKK